MRRRFVVSVRHFLAVGLFAFAGAGSLPLFAAEESIVSPDGHVTVALSDADGLRYRVTFDGDPVIVDSRLGLDFEGGFSLGRAIAIEHATREEHDGTWDNP